MLDGDGNPTIDETEADAGRSRRVADEAQGPQMTAIDEQGHADRAV